MHSALKYLLGAVVLSHAAQLYAQSGGPVFPNPGKVSMSREDQHALGMQAAGQVYQQMPVLPDNSPETQCVQQVGHKLVAAIPSEYSWPFEFHVVAQKEINAFALPGGPMFINVGTITASSNEAELAGVMAHEMAHVYMQHSAKQAGKAQTTSMLAGIAEAVLGGTAGNMAGGMVGQLGQMGIQMGAQGLMMKYSRSDEAQADAVGAMILYKAGYNPQAMADFFRTLGSQGGPAPPAFFSDHPNPGDRERDIQKEIESWPAENFASDSPVFRSARQHATGVKTYTGEEIAQGAKSGQWDALNKQNGATFNSRVGAALSSGATTPSATTSPDQPLAPSDNVFPSPRMIATNLGGVSIHRPENWQVLMPEKQGQFVTIAPRSAITNNGVGYGALLNRISPQQGGQMSIDEITNQLVNNMQQNNGLEPMGNAEVIAAGNTQGRSISFRSASPIPGANGQTQMERDWLVTLPQRDNSVIFIIFVAPQSEFARFQPTYQAMLKSLQFQ
jgi:Zn-dependent protease with chaperone function